MKSFNNLLITLLITFFTCIATVAHAGGSGIASWYGGDHHEGRFTASGEVFNGKLMTAASNSHKMGTMLKVTNLANGKSVVVKVNDTGGFKKYGRVLDLSKSAFSSIANTGSGLIKVKYEEVGFQPVVRHPASYKKQSISYKKVAKKSYKQKQNYKKKYKSHKKFSKYKK